MPFGCKATTNSKHSLPVAPNLLEQDFSAGRPGQKWVSDITYIWTDEGWLYLAAVLELYSRRVIGWAISERMTATLVCDASSWRYTLWGTSGTGRCQRVWPSILTGAASIVRRFTRNCSTSTSWFAAWAKKATVMTTPPWKVGATASRPRRCMANASGPVPRPSSRCPNIFEV
jgi:transposase InsO family protein